MSFQCRNVTVLDGGEVLANPILILIPPADGLQRRDGLLVKPFADGFGGHTTYDGVGRHVLGDHSLKIYLLLLIPRSLLLINITIQSLIIINLNL